MKIVWKDRADVCMFNQIVGGNVFTPVSNTDKVYMKLEEEAYIGGMPYNSVCLDTGYFESFDSIEDVISLCAELVVEG